MTGRIDGLGVGLAVAGALVLYSGIKGYSIPHALTAFVQGHAPTGAAQYPIGSSTGTSSSAASSISSTSSSSTGSYSTGQLASLWIMAGGDPAKASVAACIATHESEGDPAVTSPNPDGGTNVGLWQLDTEGKGAGYTIAQLQDPVTNARVAIAGSSNGTNWSAWSTSADCGA